MKGILTIAAIAALCSVPLTATAQLSVPLSSADGYDDSGNHLYVVSAVSPTVTSIATTGTQHSPGDDGSSAAAIGFTFNFFGTDYTDLSISGNGHVTLGAGSYINGANSNSAHPEDNGGSIHTNYDGARIDFYWDDLDSGAGGAVYSETRGAAGSQEFVVEFDQVPPYDNTLLTTVQMILYEGTNEITMNYMDVNGTGTARNGLAIGIQGSDTSYLQYGWFPAESQNGPLTGSGIPASGESLLFTPIPEPASLVLFALAGMGLIAVRRRRG